MEKLKLIPASLVTDRAVSLIKKLHGAKIGAIEFSGGWMPERVDAILFNSQSSFVIETKISRQDFKADAKKAFRTNGRGVGKYRYYACPAGLIQPDELPEKWGLIYIYEGRRGPTMPIGYGGRMKIGEEKHPTYGWSQGVFMHYGSPDNPHNIEQFWEHRDYPSKKFAFEDRDMEIECRYPYALCTRYKSQKFMETIL